MSEGIHLLNSYSALQRFKNRAGINVDRGNTTGNYMITNKIRRELEAISVDDWQIIKKIVYKKNTKKTRGEMINIAITRMDKFDKESLEYVLETIQEEGMEVAIKLFFVSLTKLRNLAVN